MADLAAFAPPEGYTEGEAEEPAANVSTSREVIERLMRWSDPKRTINIADELSDTEIGPLGQTVIYETSIDEGTRSEWLTASDKAMKLAMQKAEAKQKPWPGCSNVIWPLITEAADQFAARSYPAIVANRSVVKGVVHGSDDGQMLVIRGQQIIDPATGQPIWLIQPGEKQRIATAIGEHMSYQILEEMEEWEEDMDRLLHVLPIIGCEFRKTFFDPTEGRNFSVRVPAKDLIINYWAKSIYTAPRLTEVVKMYPYEIEEARRSGHFRDIDYGVAMDGGNDSEAPLEFYEQHRRIDLDHDGYPEPYIVTVSKDTGAVARIVARYDPEGVMFSRVSNTLAKIAPVHYYTKFDFLPNKEGGIYGQGFSTSLVAINESINGAINMLFDAGTAQNTGGGFIARSLSMHSGTVKFLPGEWKVVNAAGGDISKAMIRLEHPGPSQTMFELLGLLIEAGKDVSSVKDVLTGEIRAQTMSPTVFMALVEQGLKVYTAIFKRVHRSLRTEFDKLFRLNRIYLEEQASYRTGNQWKQITRDFYAKGQGIEPISDPNMVADAQKMAKSSFLLEVAKENPDVDHKEVTRRALEAANIDGPEKLLVEQAPPDPAIIQMAAELELKGIETKAKAIEAMSAAVKNLADADASVQESFQTWAAQQIELMKFSVESINAKPGGSGGDTGGQPGAVQPVEAPPGDPGLPALPPGLPGGLEAGSPAPVGAGPAA